MNDILQLFLDVVHASFFFLSIRNFVSFDTDQQLVWEHGSLRHRADSAPAAAAPDGRPAADRQPAEEAPQVDPATRRSLVRRESPGVFLKM